MRGQMNTPCDNCPFRSDVRPYLRPERGREIWAALQQGGTFPCHKTTVHVETDDGEDLVSGPDSLWCGGALRLLETRGGADRNQMVRIGERLGIIDLTKLDREAPVYESPEDWFRALGCEAVEAGLEYCDVVGVDCENPPGFGGGGSVWDNEDPPTCDPENCCTHCGNVMCPPCARPDGRCENCEDDEVED